MPNRVTYKAVNTTLAVIDTVPDTALNRTSRIHRPRRPPQRSRHVQRSCQAKLWRMAASTASAVATR